MSWGGARSGAGAPKRGVSQARRLLVDALHRGLEQAGRLKGLNGSPHEVATEAAARIACDMVLAGRGDEVLKLYAIATPATDDLAGSGGRKSALMEALERLPGMVGEGAEGPETSLDDGGDGEICEQSATCDGGSGDGKSDVAPSESHPVTLDAQGQVIGKGGGAFFDPQPMLIEPDGFELAGARGAYGARAARPATPHTPPAGPRGVNSLDGKNLDSSGGAA